MYNNNTTNKTTSKGVKLVNTGWVPYGKLRPFALNRDENAKHSNRIKESTKIDGSFRAFSVFKESNDGYIDMFDTHHLYWGMSDTHDDELVPVNEVWWVDPNDDDAKYKYLKIANENKLNWTVLQHIKSLSDKIGGDYTFLYNMIQLYKKNLPIGAIVAAFSGLMRVNQDSPIRQGTMKLDEYRKSYGKLMCNEFANLMIKTSGSGLKNNRLRILIPLFYEEAKSVNSAVFKTYLNRCLEDLELSAQTDGIPTNDASLKDYYENTLKSRHSSILTNAI
jgi:hypothetical protein